MIRHGRGVMRPACPCSGKQQRLRRYPPAVPACSRRAISLLQNKGIPRDDNRSPSFRYKYKRTPPNDFTKICMARAFFLLRGKQFLYVARDTGRGKLHSFRDVLPPPVSGGGGRWAQTIVQGYFIFWSGAVSREIRVVHVWRGYLVMITPEKTFTDHFFSGKILYLDNGIVSRMKSFCCQIMSPPDFQLDS